MKIHKRYLALVTLALFLSMGSNGQAQTKVQKVMGTVIDADNLPLQGVSVNLIEGRKTAVTDVNGQFEIESDKNSKVVLQKKGYETVQVLFQDLKISKVVLKKSIIEAGESDIVAIPFGDRTKREISGSISTINGSQLPNSILGGLSTALAGLMPGLYVKQSGTAPGYDNASLLVRGQSTFTSQNMLFVVDGAIRDFNNMDANEIESISVLKDAASLAWYGLRGANGVVYVKTKRGSQTKTQVTFDVSTGAQAPENSTKPMDSYTYANLYNEARLNSGLTAKYDQTALDAYQSGSDPYKYPNNNYIGQFMKDYSPVQRYVATVSGGNATARYFTLASFYNQGGLFNNTEQPTGLNTNVGFKRYNIRTNVDVKISNNLDVSLDVGGRSENRFSSQDGYGNILNAINTTPANAYPLLNLDGSYGGTSIFQNNPLAMLQKRGYVSTNTRVLLASISAKYKLDDLVKGLSANIFYSYDVTQAFTSGKTQNFEVYELKPDGLTYNRYGTKARLTYSQTGFGFYDSRMENWGGLSYNNAFGNHAINADVRYQQSLRNRPNVLDDKTQGVSARALYSFKNRYFVEAATSYSGSQYFPKDNRFFWYPAASAGWVVSEENFLKNFKPISYLKLRGSYGLTGNIGTIDRAFSYNNLWDRATGNGYPFGTSFSLSTTATQLPLANANLMAEKVAKTNVGVDLKVLDQALTFTADYFFEKRNNILTGSVTPSIIGQSLVNVNEGSAQYEGVEGSVNYSMKIGKVNLSIFGNATFIESKVLYLNESGIPAYQSQIGMPVSAKRVLLAEGLFQTQTEIDNAPKQQFSGTVAPGDIKYKDMNNDGYINGLDFVTTDKTDLPSTYYGFGCNVSYAGFDISALFQGVIGRTADVSSLVNMGNNNNGYINQFSVDRWTPATAQTALYPRLLISDRGNNTQYSTFWFRSGDYLRLKSVEIGYSLPEKFLSKIKLKECRFHVEGLNLLTFKQMKEAVDPEMVGAGFGSSYPYLKTVSLGLNLKF